MSNIPELDLEAANLAQIIDAVLEKKTAIAGSEEAVQRAYADSQREDAANSSDGALQPLDQAHKQREHSNSAGGSVERIREDLASLTAQRERLLKALEAANRKAAIGELTSELKDLTSTIENQLVRYAALMHLTKGTPLDLLSIESLYGRESKKLAQKMVAEIEQGWRQG